MVRAAEMKFGHAGILFGFVDVGMVRHLLVRVRLGPLSFGCVVWLSAATLVIWLVIERLLLGRD